MKPATFKKLVSAWWFAVICILAFGFYTKANAQTPAYTAPSTAASVAVNISTATTTKLISGLTNRWIYITNFNVIAGGTGNIQLVYGTGTLCATGQVALTGAYNLTAQAGLVLGSGIAPTLVVPTGNDVCAVTSAAVQMSGSISYAQP